MSQIIIPYKNKKVPLREVCENLGLDYKICSCRYYRGDSVERILRPTNVRWKKKDKHMTREVIDKELKGKTPISGLYEGMTQKQIDVLLSGNTNALLREF